MASSIFQSRKISLQMANFIGRVLAGKPRSVERGKRAPAEKFHAFCVRTTRTDDIRLAFSGQISAALMVLSNEEVRSPINRSGLRRVMKIKWPNRSGGALTMIEVLMIIGVIAVLSALLIPAIGRAKEKSRRIGCVCNLKQIGLSTRLFANDHAELFPM